MIKALQKEGGREGEREGGRKFIRILPIGGVDPPIVGDTMMTDAALTDKCWVFDLKNTEPGAVVLSHANAAVYCRVCNSGISTICMVHSICSIFALWWEKTRARSAVKSGNVAILLVSHPRQLQLGRAQTLL